MENIETTEERRSKTEANETEELTVKSKRSLKKPRWLEDYNTSFIAFENEPNTYEEAMLSENKENWKVAVENELKTLKENNTWTEVQKVPEDTEVISSKWVFKIKDVEEKKIYKARLVARGFEQRNCEIEVYSPVARLPPFRTFLWQWRTKWDNMYIKWT